MPLVVALTSFDHGGSRRRDAQFDLSEPTAKELAQRGLVRILKDNPRWQEVVCIASGPSLTPEDCEKVRSWREGRADRGVIVTNTTYKLCPWADILYAMDRVWWKQYSSDAQKIFKGERITCNQRIAGVKTIHFKHPKNSGAGAMVLAESFGARRLILLGFDCQYSADGMRHWHGDHPKGLGNAVSMPKWHPQFKEVAGLLGHCTIINASRSTALDFWKKQPLEQALEC